MCRAYRVGFIALGEFALVKPSEVWQNSSRPEFWDNTFRIQGVIRTIILCHAWQLWFDIGTCS